VTILPNISAMLQALKRIDGCRPIVPDHPEREAGGRHRRGVVSTRRHRCLGMRSRGIRYFRIETIAQI
jgi:hypothetical protein